MYSAENEIFGLSLNTSQKSDILPPIAKIDFNADSISYLASKLILNIKLQV